MRLKKWSSDVGTRKRHTKNLWNLLKKKKNKQTTTTTKKRKATKNKKGKWFANPKKGRKTDRNEGIMT